MSIYISLYLYHIYMQCIACRLRPQVVFKGPGASHFVTLPTAFEMRFALFVKFPFRATMYYGPGSGCSVNLDQFVSTSTTPQLRQGRRHHWRPQRKRKHDWTNQ